MVPAIAYRVQFDPKEIFLYDESGQFKWPSTCRKVWALNQSGGVTEISERVRLKLVNHATFTLGPKRFNQKTRRWELP